MKKFYEDYAKMLLDLAKQSIVLGVATPFIALVFQGVGSAWSYLVLSYIFYKAYKVCLKMAKQYYQMAEEIEKKEKK